VKGQAPKIMMMRSRLQPRATDRQAIKEAATTALPSPFNALTPAEGKPTPGSVIEKISLDQLAFGPAGCRKIKPQSIQALAARIHATGQLHSLMVVLSEDAQYYVVAGERRFAALQLLAEKGLILRSFPVPCRVIQAKAATEAGLVSDFPAGSSDIEADERRRRFLDLRKRCPGLLTGSELAARQC
jgi:ParB-like nuclease family protein